MNIYMRRELQARIFVEYSQTNDNNNITGFMPVNYDKIDSPSRPTDWAVTACNSYDIVVECVECEITTR